MYVCHVVESSFFFCVDNFFYFCACEETKVIKAVFSHFSQRWISKFLAHRQIENQTLSG